LICELAEQSAAHNDTPANLKKIQYDFYFPAEAQSEHAHGFMQ
jgi:hypothetical protein